LCSIDYVLVWGDYISNVADVVRMDWSKLTKKTLKYHATKGHGKYTSPIYLTSGFGCWKL